MVHSELRPIDDVHERLGARAHPRFKALMLQAYAPARPKTSALDDALQSPRPISLRPPIKLEKAAQPRMDTDSESLLPPT